MRVSFEEMGKFKRASDMKFQMVPEELQLRFPGLKKNILVQPFCLYTKNYLPY